LITIQVTPSLQLQKNQQQWDLVHNAAELVKNSVLLAKETLENDLAEVAVNARIVDVLT